ncbi:MAG: hypothetical protein ACXABY_05040 [Candidatus Thorarchaeota archaeon]|jgi:hypothetical protein
MAILTDQQCTAIRQLLHEDGLDLLEAESPHLTKPQIKDALQAIEDWYESERINVKADIVTAIGRPISNALAKKLGKFWMRMKWGLE